MPLRLGPPWRLSMGTESAPCSMRFNRAAKADSGRRFRALFDKIHRRDVLQRAWEQVRRNRGAPGIDRITLAAVEEYGADGCSVSWSRI